MRAARQTLSTQLSALPALERPALIDLWCVLHGHPPPKNLSAVFLRRALAYEAQCAAEGGPKLRVLKHLTRTPPTSITAKPLAPSLPAGARLVREWNGRSYHVEVAEGGFVMGGKPWASLSAIARHITGAHWPGPRFFGLTRTATSPAARPTSRTAIPPA